MRSASAVPATVPPRPAAEARHRPGAVLSLHTGVIALLFGLQFVLPPFHAGMLARILVLATYATGYNVLLGYAGLMSLGHAALFASGMYATGLLVYYGDYGGPAAFAGGLGASLGVSTLLGFATLRAGGVAFLMLTLMLAQAFYLATLHLNRITLGEQGFILSGRLRPLVLGGRELPFAAPAVKYNLALAVFATGLVLTLWLAASPVGRVLAGLRENAERTRLLGYDPFRYRLAALVLSGTLAGMAGATYTLLFSYVGSTFASVLYSIYPLLWTLLGGAGTALGPLVGTALMTYLVDVASGLTTAHLVVVGLALLAVVLWCPAGLLGTIRARWAPWLP